MAELDEYNYAFFEIDDTTELSMSNHGGICIVRCYAYKSYASITITEYNYHNTACRIGTHPNYKLRGEHGIYFNDYEFGKKDIASVHKNHIVYDD